MWCNCDREEDDENTMQVDWEWGTVKYKTNNFRPSVAVPAKEEPAAPPVPSARHSRSDVIAVTANALKQQAEPAVNGNAKRRQVR